MTCIATLACNSSGSLSLIVPKLISMLRRTDSFTPIFVLFRCGIPYIMLEMDRILRPGGAAIIRDAPDVVHKVKDAADRLHWHSEIVDIENGGLDPEKLLIVDNSLPFPDHPA